MFRKTFFCACLLLIVALSLAACGPAAGVSTGVSRPTADEAVSATFNIEKPTVVVSTFNGAIDVSIGGAGVVNVVVTKRGSGDTAEAAKADVKNIQVTMNQDGNTVRVTANRSDRQANTGNSGALVKVMVPAGAILDLKTSNADVTVAGAVGDVSAQDANGGLDVRGATGALTLNTSNGNITSTGGSGKLKIGNSNGVIDVTSTNEAQVDISNVNGVIRFNGVLAPKTRNTLRNSNADIAVTLPASSSFALNATTSNGKVTSDFVVSGNSQNNQQLKGTVGQDRQTILNLTTNNADIEIHKGG